MLTSLTSRRLFLAQLRSCRVQTTTHGCGIQTPLAVVKRALPHGILFSRLGFAQKYSKLYSTSNVIVPEKGIEGFGGPSDPFHYSDLVEKYCRNGIAKRDAGDTQGALDFFSRAIEASNNTSLRAFSLRADLYQVREQFQEALADYNSVLRTMPTHVPTLTSRASCHKRLGDYEKAKNEFDFILTFEGKYAPAWMGKGECHANLGEHDEAVKAFEVALKYKDMFVPTAKLYEAYGDSLVMCNKLEEALVAYREALALAPLTPSCLAAYGVALYLARKYPEATDALTEALNNGAGPRHELLAKRASCYLHFENVDKALADCDETLALQPNFFMALLVRGQIRQMREDMEGAAQDFTVFIEESDKLVSDSARLSTEVMSEQNHQLATVYTRRAECYMELWARHMSSLGYEVSSELDNFIPPTMNSNQTIQVFEDIYKHIAVLDINLKKAFEDLVAARRLAAMHPDVPILISYLKALLETPLTNMKKRK